MKRQYTMGLCFLIISACFLITSCLGIKTTVSMKRDGSGTIDLEYRIAGTLDSLGKLDGNEAWQTIPVGRADFERTVERIEGLKMSSFSSKESGGDVVNTVKLEFAHPEALASFMDGTGRFAQGGNNTLSLELAEGGGNTDPELEILIRELFEGYSFDFTLSAPGNPALSFSSGSGFVANPPLGKAENGSGRANYTVPMADLMTSVSGITMRVEW